MPETLPPVFEENITSAAIDGVRISAVTAQALIELDPRLAEDHKVYLLRCLEGAREWLDAAREALPVETTSLHVVTQNPSRIIIPS